MKETRKFHERDYYTLRLVIRVGVTGRGVPHLAIRGRVVLTVLITRSCEYDDALGHL